LIDKYAQLGTQKPLLLQNKSSGLNQFGLKIHSLFYSKEKIENFVDENLNDICASIQHTIIEILMDKLKLAVKKQVLHKSLLAEFRQILEFETP
jgi:N6-L-threonylcarbamoyladenine synthase